MTDLSVKCLGLELKNPIIIASSPLTADVESMKKCEAAGAAAVVVKSIFEEQIESSIKEEKLENEEYLFHSDSAEAFEALSRYYYLGTYLETIRNAKSELSIPVIASINCTRLSSWISYIEHFEESGADAIELNYYPIAADSATEGREVEQRALELAREVRKATKLPVSFKIGYKYSSLANMIHEFDSCKLDGLVLFNRFFRPDIDIEKIDLMPSTSVLSSEDEYSESLRWIALMSQEVGFDLIAATGIHNASTVVKMLLAGASACQICSAAMKDLKVVREMTDGLSSWMERHGFKSIDEFRGRLAQESFDDGMYWERTQYMKRLQGED